MATISQIAHPVDPAMLKNNSPISPPPFDRCNLSPSSASSSSSSASSLDQQRVKPRQSVGKRFLVSRVQQHLANCPWPEELGEGQQPEEMQEQEEEEELISFRYNWPVRISERWEIFNGFALRRFKLYQKWHGLMRFGREASKRRSWSNQQEGAAFTICLLHGRIHRIHDNFWYQSTPLGQSNDMVSKNKIIFQTCRCQ